LLGTATCETYLRCQVYHPTMETDWDLQAVRIISKAPLLFCSLLNVQALGLGIFKKLVLEFLSM